MPDGKFIITKYFNLSLSDVHPFKGNFKENVKKKWNIKNETLCHCSIACVAFETAFAYKKSCEFLQTRRWAIQGRDVL